MRLDGVDIVGSSSIDAKTKWGATMQLLTVLFVFVLGPYGKAVTTQEFYGPQACDTAKHAVEAVSDNIKAVCVSKGTGK